MPSVRNGNFVKLIRRAIVRNASKPRASSILRLSEGMALDQILLCPDSWQFIQMVTAVQVPILGIGSPVRQ